MRFYKALLPACTWMALSSLAFASDDQMSDISSGMSKPIVWDKTIPSMSSNVKNIDNVTLHAYIFHPNAPETKALSAEDKRQLSLLIYTNAQEFSPFEVEMLTHQQFLSMGFSIGDVAQMERIHMKLQNNQPLTKEENDLLRKIVNNLQKSPGIILAPMLSLLPKYVKENNKLFSPDAPQEIQRAAFQAVGLTKAEMGFIENRTSAAPLTPEEGDAVAKIALLSKLPIGYTVLQEKQSATLSRHLPEPVRPRPSAAAPSQAQKTLPNPPIHHPSK